MDAFLQQVLAGLATGGIYASVALALVMIYQATHLVNFAQGEMAMFCTYIAWSADQRGHALLGGVLRSRSRFAFVLGVLDRAHHHPAGRERAGARHRHRLHRPAGDLQQRSPGWIFDLHHQGLPEPVPRASRCSATTYFSAARARRDRRDAGGAARCSSSSSASRRSAWPCARRRRTRCRAGWSASASAGCWRWAGAWRRRSARWPA